MLSYECLRIIWWGLLGVLIAGFAMMDGFDLGVAALLPFVAKTDTERRITINTVGPVWEGNQVWFILGGGAIFAAWPALYAVSFSGFYTAMFLVLVTFIIRPVAFKYRSKLFDPMWRQTWDMLMCTAAIVVCILFGVAVGNVLQGVPFHFDDSLRPFYTGTFWQLVNPFAVGCGVLSLCMLLMHGAGYLITKTSAKIHNRARQWQVWMGLATTLLFVAAGWYMATHIPGYVLMSQMDPSGPSNPLHKQVARDMGAWLQNYTRYPWMLVAPALGIGGSLLCTTLGALKHARSAFICSGLAIFGIITTVGLSMFPFILPSSSQPNASLMLWDASSSRLTLVIMLVATVIFLPIVLAYTSWVFKVLRGPVTAAKVNANDQSY